MCSPFPKQTKSITETVIVGAGPAGLAVGACLSRAGVPFVILEREERAGSAWRRHYERLHLHTDKARSELPYLPYPKHYPRYPSCEQVISYLENYAAHFGLEPRIGQEVLSARHQDGLWRTETQDSVYLSRRLVVATGYNGEPHIPRWPGQEDFRGEILHSSSYKSGAPYRGKRVLVVGFGNSGGEIAVDLHEHGARVALSVRSPVNVIPRELFGLPILAIAIPLSKLPTSLADTLTAPIVRVRFGDLGRLGLRKATGGPFTQIQKHQRIPLIDVGTMGLIRKGHIDVRPRVERVVGEEVVFSDGSRHEFDTIVLATGYRPALEAFLEDAPYVVDERGCPLRSGDETILPGLYFCGFYVSPAGMLREISMEAKRIARDISKKYARGIRTPPTQRIG